ncbi:MAG: hypothetical protein M1820_002182 [Bogoriella megaspora]|nr:MAG: hypothetical protein M1820_002182 [Bogoriella megaspora]
MAATTISPEYAGYCFLPPGIGLPNGYAGAQCPAPSQILLTFLYFGIVSISFNIVFGYRDIRAWFSEHLPFPESDSDSPSPWPGIASIALQLLVSTGVAGIIVHDSFDVSFHMIFFIYLLRPRFHFVTQLINFATSSYDAEDKEEGPYTELLFDLYLSESVLEIIGIYIALQFVGLEQSTDTPCANVVVMPTDVQHMMRWLKGSARVLASCGFANIITLSIWVVGRIQTHNEGSTAGVLWGMVLGTVIHMLYFTFSWVFWASFLKLAGEAFCPPGIVAFSILIGFLPLLGNLARAWTS